MIIYYSSFRAIDAAMSAFGQINSKFLTQASRTTFNFLDYSLQLPHMTSNFVMVATDLIFVIFSPQMYFLRLIFLHVKARKL